MRREEYEQQILQEEYQVQNVKGKSRKPRTVVKANTTADFIRLIQGVPADSDENTVFDILSRYIADRDGENPNDPVFMDGTKKHRRKVTQQRIKEVLAEGLRKDEQTR